MSEVLQAARTSGFPAPIFIHRASVEAADAFFAARAPEARAVADPDGALFQAFGLQRGSVLQLLGPSVWWRAFRAVLKGNFVGRPTGSETQMPGAFLVRGREVLWQHRARHAGDHPDLGAVLRALDPTAAPDASSARKASNRKLVAEHRKLLAEARDVQRSGDLRAYAAMMERAGELERRIDELEERRT